MEDDDEWYELRGQLAREQWLDSRAARRQAGLLFLWILAILVGVSLFTLALWLVYNVIFVPGAPPER